MPPAVPQVMQAIMLETERGRIVAVDSAYDARPVNRGRDVIVNASYSGVLPARFIGEHAPRGAIGVDCGIGPDGAGVAGLWYLEALSVPAAAADIATVVLGDGADMYASGVISRVNAIAERCGVAPGMTVRDAARHILTIDPASAAPADVTHREVMAEAPNGRRIVCIDSIAFGIEEDRRRSVLCTAGHTGRSAVPYLRAVMPWGFICSDGGVGRRGSGTAGLAIVEADGLAGASVDATTARMGDGHSTYYDGVISAVNDLAARRGVAVGQTARDAAMALLGNDPTEEVTREQDAARA